MPILADGEVKFIGEKVAAVAAESELIAEEAVNLIEVEYEETTPLLDPVEALKPGAKLIHPDVMNYKGLPKPLKEPTNDFVYVTWGKGDPETGFRQAERHRRKHFHDHRWSHESYIEPHSCVVSVAADGSAEVLVLQQGALRRPGASRQRAQTAARKTATSIRSI